LQEAKAEQEKIEKEARKHMALSYPGHSSPQSKRPPPFANDDKTADAAASASPARRGSVLAAFSEHASGESEAAANPTQDESAAPSGEAAMFANQMGSNVEDHMQQNSPGRLKVRMHLCPRLLVQIVNAENLNSGNQDHHYIVKCWHGSKLLYETFKSKGPRTAPFWLESLLQTYLEKDDPYAEELKESNFMGLSIANKHVAGKLEKRLAGMEKKMVHAASAQAKKAMTKMSKKEDKKEAKKEAMDERKNSFFSPMTGKEETEADEEDKHDPTKELRLEVYEQRPVPLAQLARQMFSGKDMRYTFLGEVVLPMDETKLIEGYRQYPLTGGITGELKKAALMKREEEQERLKSSNSPNHKDSPTKKNQHIPIPSLGLTIQIGESRELTQRVPPEILKIWASGQKTVQVVAKDKNQACSFLTDNFSDADLIAKSLALKKAQIKQAEAMRKAREERKAAGIEEDNSWLGRGARLVGLRSPLKKHKPANEGKEDDDDEAAYDSDEESDKKRNEKEKKKKHDAEELQKQNSAGKSSPFSALHMGMGNFLSPKSAIKAGEAKEDEEGEEDEAKGTDDEGRGTGGDKQVDKMSALRARMEAKKAKKANAKEEEEGGAEGGNGMEALRSRLESKKAEKEEKEDKAAAAAKATAKKSLFSGFVGDSLGFAGHTKEEDKKADKVAQLRARMAAKKDDDAKLAAEEEENSADEEENKVRPHV
jgi:hypothetical protein